MIRVEFQLEKKREFLDLGGGYFSIPADNTFVVDDNTITQTTSGNNSPNIISSGDISVSYSSAEPGATIGGSESDQKFSKIDIDLEDETWVVELQMKGI